MNYTMTQENFNKLNDILDYFKYHNKNLTQKQDIQIYDLEDTIAKIKDYNLIVEEGEKYFSNYGEDITINYYIKKREKTYNLSITYLGCVEDGEENIDNVYLENSFGAYFEVYSKDEKINDELINYLEYELSDFESSYDSISGIDYNSFSNSEEIKNKIIELL